MLKKDSKIFVAGHRGLVGSAIVRELKNKGYEIEYYIPRIYDTPIIGKLKDIKKITMDQVLNKLSNDLNTEYFTYA